MKNHVKVYMSYYGYGEEDIIPCVCGKKAVDIHHLVPRGMGGSKLRDNIENLIALCRECHDKAESDKTFNNELIKRKEYGKINKTNSN